jgi:hypothetical protein
MPLRAGRDDPCLRALSRAGGLRSFERPVLLRIRRGLEQQQGAGTGAPIDLAGGSYNVQMFFNGSTSAATTVT